MSHTEDKAPARLYLLGDMSAQEREQFEMQMMIDNEIFDLMLLAEDDLLDDYVQNRLSEQDKFKFEAAFLSTEEGRRQLDFSRALHNHVASYKRDKQRQVQSFPGLLLRGHRSAFAARAIAMSVFVIAAGLAAWLLFLRADPVSEGRAALIALYTDRRPTQSRLDGFHYAPFVALMGGDQNPQTDRAKRDRAGLLILNAADKRPEDADAIHLLGQYYLSAGDFDEALVQFRKARGLAPNDAKILSDLGGALLEKARRQEPSSAKSVIFDECLRSLNRAAEISPSLAEVYFNRALCNELLMQWQSAESDWRHYLDLDSTSAWAAEARQALDRIDEQKRRGNWDEPRFFNDFVDAAQQRNEEAGWHALSVSFGTRSSQIVERLIDEVVNDQPRGNQTHAMLLKWAGQIVRAKVGDRQVSDTAKRYARCSTPELALLQEARRRSSEGVTLLHDWKLRDARKAFGDAALQFDKLGDSPEALYARYLEAQCCLRIPDLEAASKLFNDLHQTARSKSYRWLESRAYDGLAEVHFSRSEYSRAIEFSRQALDLSRALNNVTCIGRSCLQLSEVYLRLGDYDEAGSFAWEGLQSVNTQPVNLLQSSLPYEAAADLFTATRQRDLAMMFQIESLRRAESAGYPAKISFANAHIGRLYAELGDRSRAFEHIQRAAEVAATLPESEAGDVRAFASLCAADLYRGEGDLDRAISNYEEALGSYVRSGRHNLAFAASMGKLLCHIKRGDVAEAKAELLSIGSLIEQFSGEIVEEKTRVLFTEGLNEFRCAAIEFAYSTLGEPDMAYQYSEMFRARSLLDLATSPIEATSDREGVRIKSRTAPLNPDEIKAGVPQEAQLLQYAVLDERSIAWVVSGGKIQICEIPVSKEELTNRVKRFIDLCRRPDAADVTEESTSLYEILIRPTELLLNSEKQLCIVADDVLSGLPFAALKSPRTHRYLVQDYVISTAPSATLFVRCTDWAKQKSSASSERVLSVGDPEFDRSKHNLNRLPYAGREAKAIAELYPSRTILIGSQANEMAVSAAMTHSEVINLATHYLTDPRSPMLSKLVLSNDSASPHGIATDGELHGYELYGMKLPITKLVVLSGCETLGDKFLNLEGAVGAARPFISAGVPLVVATFWPVDDKASSDLVLEFHRQRRTGGYSARALRESQLKMIRSGDYRQAPFYWAGFSLIGGYANF
jgi:CHAT domain-containing protein